MGHIWCSTSAASPRKHAQPEVAQNPVFSVTLGSGHEDRIVNAVWQSGDIRATVSVSVESLRHMLNVAESYKPGATLKNPRGVETVPLNHARKVLAEEMSDAYERGHAEGVRIHSDLLAACKGMLEWARRVKGCNPGLEVRNAVVAVANAESGAA